MAVDDARQMTGEILVCLEMLEKFCDALEARDSVDDPERWIEAAGNVAKRAREYLDALREEIDDWEFSVGLSTNGLDSVDDSEEEDDGDEDDDWLA